MSVDIDVTWTGARELGGGTCLCMLINCAVVLRRYNTLRYT